MVTAAPTLRLERQLLRSGYARVAGVDEVGRGCLAGPVSVGVCVVDLTTRTAPTGVRDSKLLTATQREVLYPKLADWPVGYAVGEASAAEIDQHGIMTALRMAAGRAWAGLTEHLGEPPAQVAILDGKHDWLGSTFAVPVVTRIGADRTCASVAAASVLAKCQRDAYMVQLAAQHPEYGWAENKGYAAPSHLAALTEFGTTSYHRVSWRLPGAQASTPTSPRDAARALNPVGQQGDLFVEC